jgi:uncharacterized membrane protein YbaN (DUF454 family)
MADQHRSAEDLDKKRLRSSRFKKGFFIVAGSLSLALGCIGIVLPILPTTPFLLLSAACYYKGSDRMHRWLLNNRWFGSYIRNYKEGRGLSLRAKFLTLAVLWLVISYSAFFIVNILVIQAVLLAIAVGVSLHVVTLPTFKQT